MNQINLNKNETLYLDCASGISGDMMVAALLDLGADRKILLEALESLHLEGVRIEIQDVIKSGLRACDFNVILDDAHENHDHNMEYLHGTGAHHSHETMPDSVENTHPDKNHTLLNTKCPMGEHESTAAPAARNTHHHPADSASHSEHAHHHGRNLSDITALLTAGHLTPHALELALKIFQIVAEAESQVHGKPLSEVHFHEVGAVDSIIDIAAVAVCIDNLGIEQVILPSLTEGCGQIRCQHGLLPIPVPAVTAIITAHKIPVRISSVQGELVTPTGAAIAAALRTSETLPNEFKILRTGLGAGKRDYETPGILRAMLIEDTRMDCDHILVMETNIDDCSGETLGFVMEELLSAGALDVFYTPVYMKKHRPGYQLNVMCTQEKRKELEALIFRHTTTIGLRIHEVTRTKLPRKIISLETPWGMADVKCCQFEDEVYCYPESDSVIRLAKQNEMSFSEMYNKIKYYAASAK
ncbi:MAG: nickel pincer cofactor biosynthesis protein LarC [Lachnospiraceae bacterium]|nr:nickel pincer cofactor biosynthesis protein LarC [Lachnospiraceae bacterium]